jgi:hypothetical protein
LLLNLLLLLLSLLLLLLSLLLLLLRRHLALPGSLLHIWVLVMRLGRRARNQRVGHIRTWSSVHCSCRGVQSSKPLSVVRPYRCWSQKHQHH